MRSRAPLVVSLAAVLLLAGCGGDDGNDAAADDRGDGIVVVATEYEFEPAELSIAADTAVEIFLDNEGIIEHDWTVDELDVQIHADAGETASATVTAPAGTYEVYCSVPGHRDAGMEGVLTVG